MKILIGCEESQAVCIEFRKLGFEAYSCDILPCSGGHPEWHIQMDVFEAIEIIKPEVLICFPPCTDLAVSGSRSFEQKRRDGRQQKSISFFMSLANSNIKHIAIENPIGIMSNYFRKPDQIIQPYYFGDNVKKSTCLWLKNLPLLIHEKETNLFFQSTHTEPVFVEFNSKKTKSGKSKYSGGAAMWFKTKEERSKYRSKTFPGIAKNMATQWGEFLKEKYQLTETI